MFISKTADDADSSGLLARADRVRRELCGDEVHLRGILEFSNICSRNCLYCGLRRDNLSLPRYKMTVDEILATVAKAASEGVRTVVLQSGENDNESVEFVTSAITAIKNEFDVAVTLCLGVKTWDFYLACRQVGADRYLLKHEIASPEFYRRFHPDSELYDRLDALSSLQALGYQTGTGNIVGLPGQTEENLAEDILLAEALDVDMAAFGPFVPHPDTPLKGHTGGSLHRALCTVAAARIRLGSVHIPATTAFDAIAPNGREFALQSGANVLMANITPPAYRSAYDLYPREHFHNSLRTVKDMLERLGRPLATDHGHSLKRGRTGIPC